MKNISKYYIRTIFTYSLLTLIIFLLGIFTNIFGDIHSVLDFPVIGSGYYVKLAPIFLFVSIIFIFFSFSFLVKKDKKSFWSIFKKGIFSILIVVITWGVLGILQPGPSPQRGDSHNYQIPGVELF